ncbi:MAG: GAF domain-containing protein, partial [Flammeovirgaceae bacterium]|nr:GAF domain-containing protein [Flammeovirgaceae bacterium]MDW8287153.1 GAF domain-containing protein [Flammeovirgaceae bacterium]
LRQLKERDEMQKWVATGLASVNDLLIATGDFEKLSHKVLKELIMYLQAYQGAMYIVQQDDNGKKTLHMVSAYAYNKRQKIDKVYEMGEGLIGEVAEKKKTIFLDSIPEGYMSIASGLGEAIPRSIVIVPLKLKEDVMGVLEIASFNTLKKYEIDFLEQVSENIAATILSTQATSKTAKLLEEARYANEQLKAQEEEMRQNLEELVATQEEMMRKQAEIEKIEERNKALERDLKLKEARISEWQNRFIQMTKKIESLQNVIAMQEDKAEANQAFAQSLINGSPHAILIFSEEGFIKSFNLPAIKLFGLKSEQFQQMPIKDLLGEDYKEALLIPKRKTARKANGEIIEIRYNLTVYTNEEGYRTYIAHIQESTKKSDEEETTSASVRLKETSEHTASSKLLKETLQLSPDTEGCFYCFNLSQEGKLEIIGDNIELITGYPKNRFLEEDGIHLADLVPEGYRHIPSKLLEDDRLNQISHVRYPLQREDGLTIWIEDISLVENTEDNGKIRLGFLWQANVE